MPASISGIAGRFDRLRTGIPPYIWLTFLPDTLDSFCIAARAQHG